VDGVEILGNPYLIDKLLNDQPIAAGAELGVMVTVKGFSRLFVMSKGDATFDINSTPSPDGSTVFTNLKETLSAGVVANAGDLKEVTKFAPHLYITVKNTSVGAGKFDVWIYGV
jgi:hypothetical protein